MIASPFKILPAPSSNETCRLDACKILMMAGFKPGISSPSLMRRINRSGLMSDPTFSKSPRIKTGLC